MNRELDTATTEVRMLPNDKLARYIGFRLEPDAEDEIPLVDAASQVEGTDFP